MERIEDNLTEITAPKETFLIVETVDEAVKAYQDPQLPAPDVGELSTEEFAILVEKIRPFEPKPLAGAVKLSLTLVGGAYRALRNVTTIF